MIVSPRNFLVCVPFYGHPFSISFKMPVRNFIDEVLTAFRDTMSAGLSFFGYFTIMYLSALSMDSAYALVPFACCIAKFLL